ncbi:multi-sensor hybrid histidine kinase [Sulfurimonas gotlandica GD1]|uniref:histidine kinase n=1 Tax=Sulfurimonas gotlandica (strain DSM 19862 / JCM 16533 / GD1) TaxID=929558 RepID=B6BIQ6_SULGG|nr:response regulator [Sulfurimonas gotlandica]EDZ63536.1 sensor histidine kinase/response regulator [Sulfurimonas gotlandica GD1]EHP30414.1 multi-sensor hybrid histidine kinase [Sulfurimonas gotlandica GD1]
MGIFSFFKNTKQESEEKYHYSDYFTKELIWDIVDSNSSMMLFFTKKDGWIGANKLFFRTFGFKNIEEFRGKYESVRELFLNESEEIFTEDDKSWLDYIKKYKQDGYHITVSTYNDEMQTINAKCHSVPRMKGFYILELEDITKLHQAELKIKEVENLKSKFLSNIGHEFRTPMNGILGFIELLQQTNLDKNQSEYLQMINRSSKSLMSNIETLLDLSQMQGGRLKLNPSLFSISQEMEKIAYNYGVVGRDKGVSVFSFIDPKLPSEINADFRKIKQVMNSLIQNAIKFTPRGGRIVVEVKLLKKQINGDCSVSFSVKDNGKGIANEQIAMITEPFIAGSQADERLGVGLSLSHGLVSLLGSELKIQSEEGYGSYFNFTINFKASKGQSYKMMPKRKVKVLLLDPSRVDEANFLTIYLRSFAIDVVKSNTLDATIYNGVETLYIIADQKDSSWMLKLGTYSKKIPVILLIDESEKLQTKLTHIVDGVFRKPLLPSLVAKQLNEIYSKDLEIKQEEKHGLREHLSALVVEDNLINQRLIQILLQEYRIIVSTALNGNEAVSMCEKNRYDIVFMDIDMPEKNGIIATKEIKEKINLNGKTPIVALTAMAMQGDKEMLLSEGLDDYMSKPLTREKLENVLDKYLKVTSV